MRKLIYSIVLFLIITIHLVIGGIAHAERRQSEDLRIAIIGAGASGLTAAYYLKKSGYKSITVYEREPSVGGKVFSYTYDDHVFELGAIWAGDDHRIIHELAEEYGIDFQPEDVNMFIRDINGNDYEPGQEYILKNYNPAEIQLALINIKLIQSKFKSLSNVGFAEAEPELFMNFDKFIKKYHIEPIAYSFRPLWVGFGYGYYNEIPALYVLKLMMPALRGLNPGINVFRRAPNGFQRLWEKVAEDLEDVRLNHTVEKVKRNDIDDGSVSIEVTANGLTETFDRIIISCDLKESLNILDASKEERELFSQVQNNNYYVHLFHADGIPYEDGTAILLEENNIPETIGHVTAIINREDAPGVWTSYQLAPWGTSSDKVLDFLEKDMERLGGYVKDIIIKKQWSYFPHVKTQTLHDGFYKRIEALQGEKGTYYIGGVMNFEVVEYTCQYAEKIIKRHFCAP